MQQTEFDSKLDEISQYKIFKAAKERPYDEGPQNVILAPPDTLIPAAIAEVVTLRESARDTGPESRAKTEDSPDGEVEKDEKDSTATMISVLVVLVAVGYFVQKDSKLSDKDVSTLISVAIFAGIMYSLNNQISAGGSTGTDAGATRGDEDDLEE